MAGKRTTVRDVNAILMKANEYTKPYGHGYFLVDHRHLNGTKSYDLVFGSIDGSKIHAKVADDITIKNAIMYATGVVGAYRAMESSMRLCKELHGWSEFNHMLESVFDA